jgi:hypothetical protein
MIWTLLTTAVAQWGCARASVRSASVVDEFFDRLKPAGPIERFAGPLTGGAGAFAFWRTDWKKAATQRDAGGLPATGSVRDGLICRLAGDNDVAHRKVAADSTRTAGAAAFPGLGESRAVSVR